jgi:formylglycine-generating enzyme required for sulfatase activity
MEFVRIEEGDFLMGSPASEAGRLDIEYRHRVSVGSYWLGIHAVTNAQYRLFKPDHDSGSYKGESLNEDTQPVVNVSWEDATAFAEWLSGKAGVEYRLPTEAEWEYAARAGTTTAYYTGEDINSKQANYDKYASKATKLVYPKKTLPVGSFPPNPWGLYDLHGNVWEWTCSIFDRGYSGAELTCASKSDAGNRAVRGGAWIREPGSLRSAYRFYMAPDARVNSLGFRLLMRNVPHKK